MSHDNDVTIRRADCVSKMHNVKYRDYGPYLTIKRRIWEKFYATKRTVYATIVLSSAAVSAIERFDNYGGNDVQSMFLGGSWKDTELNL